MPYFLFQMMIKYEKNAHKHVLRRITCQIRYLLILTINMLKIFVSIINRIRRIEARILDFNFHLILITTECVLNIVLVLIHFIRKSILD